MVTERKLAKVVGAGGCVAFIELACVIQNVCSVYWIHIDEPLPVNWDIGWIDHKATEE